MVTLHLNMSQDQRRMRVDQLLFDLDASFAKSGSPTEK